MCFDEFVFSMYNSFVHCMSFFCVCRSLYDIWICICEIISSLLAVLFAACDFRQYKNELWNLMQYYASLIFIFEFRLSSRPIVVVSQSREVFFSIVVGSVRIVSRRIVGACVYVLVALRPRYIVALFKNLLSNIIIVYRSFPAISSESIGFKLEVGCLVLLSFLLLLCAEECTHIGRPTKRELSSPHFRLLSSTFGFR